MIIAYDISDNEYRYEELLSASFLRKHSSPCGSFSAAVAVEEMPSEIFRLLWKQGEKVLFEGVCDKQEYVCGEKGRVLLLEGRTNGMYLLDNEALPSAYHDVRLQDISQRYLDTYGIYRSGVPGQNMLSSFIVRKGMSDWEVLRDFCKRAYGVYPYLHDDRELLLLPYAGEKHHVIGNETVGAIKFMEARQTIKRSSVISKVCIRDNYGAYPSEVINSQREILKIRRKRYFVPQSEYRSTAGQDAYGLIDKSMAERFFAEVTLCGMCDIKPMDSAELLDIEFDNNKMFITEVEKIFDTGGERTRLKMIDYRYRNLI